MAEALPSDVVLDVACGTGDLAQAFVKAGTRRALGIDFTVPMLQIARRKAALAVAAAGPTRSSAARRAPPQRRVDRPPARADYRLPTQRSISSVSPSASATWPNPPRLLPSSTASYARVDG